MLLFAISLLLGIYHIATTVIIAKDGVSYIRQAQNFPVNPVEVIKGQPFGYPFLIFLTHKLLTLFTAASIRTWIYAAQSTSLLCKLLSLIPLYFIGRLFVGTRKTLLAILFLVVLPYPAKTGSDTIREWPYILFLAVGFLVLHLAAKCNKWWYYGAVGVIAGSGHLIRPECAQLVIFATLWILSGLVRPCRNLTRPKSVLALAALIIGFSVPAAPYMAIRKTILPHKLNTLINPSLRTQAEKIQDSDPAYSLSDKNRAGPSTKYLTGVLREFADAIGSTLMYVLVLPLLPGIYFHFKREAGYEEKFFQSTLILFYVIILSLLYYHYGYISTRHTLPLSVLTIYYVPLGLKIIGDRLEKVLPLTKLRKRTTERLSWFLLSVIFSVIVCLPKLLMPIRTEKQCYRDTAKWLRQNCQAADFIAEPDPRISFYAQRKAIPYEEGNIPLSTKYVVRIIACESSKQTNPGQAALVKGLAGYWPADNTAKDLSGNHNHGTSHENVCYAEGKYGQAFKLNGTTNSYVHIKNATILNPARTVTVSAWIYPTKASRGTILSKNGPYAIEILDDRRIRGWLGTGIPIVWSSISSGVNLAINNWHHVALVYDGSSIRLYLDGDEQAAAVHKSGYPAGSHTAVYIGYGEPGFDNYFTGLIDEVLIFLWDLPEEKIRQLYEEGLSTETALKYRCPYDSDLSYFPAHYAERKSFRMKGKNKRIVVYENIALPD